MGFFVLSFPSREDRVITYTVMRRSVSDLTKQEAEGVISIYRPSGAIVLARPELTKVFHLSRFAVCKLVPGFPAYY